MKNEWCAELDRNGYAPSIVQADTSKCFFCQRSGVKLDRHEIFGNAMRSKSKRMGLWVSLCHTPCHLTHAHGCAEVMDWLHRLGEQACIDNYDFTIPMFREEFYTNYLEETDEGISGL